MVLDFKEIPPSNIGGSYQDLFELFACDLLETIGFTIELRPDRGPDGKKDLIVSESRNGREGITKIRWLVSCKHFAHSQKSVSDNDEQDILDRVNRHSCNGFMGVYSTIPSSGFSDKLNGLKDKIEYTIYDHTRIEKEVINLSQRQRFFISYFPNSGKIFHERYKTLQSSNLIGNPILTITLSENDLIRITQTSIILLEIDKIEKEFQDEVKNERHYILDKLFVYSQYANELISRKVFDILLFVSYGVRSNLPPNFAISLYSLALAFFPTYEVNREIKINAAKQCSDIGFHMAYDSFIHLKSFKFALYGLLILKYIHRCGKQENIPELCEIISEQYKKLESNLIRPERQDLENAKLFLILFKNDIETNDLGAPSLPKRLAILIY